MNLRYDLLSSQHFLSASLQKAVAVSQLWTLPLKTPQLRAGSIDAVRGVFRYSAHRTAGDGIDKTHRRMICTADSSTKWGLFWLMNIELLLSSSKLYPALPMCLVVRGRAADVLLVNPLIPVWWTSVLPTGLCWSPNGWYRAI